MQHSSHIHWFQHNTEGRVDKQKKPRSFMRHPLIITCMTSDQSTMCNQSIFYYKLSEISPDILHGFDIAPAEHQENSRK